MSLAACKPVAFIPTMRPEAARSFYEHVLGLTFVTDNDYATVFHVGLEPSIMLRIVRVRDFIPPAHTVFGWAVENIEQTIDDLAARGMEFLRYGYFEQNERGIWSAPDSSRVAWFKDPDGNTLSISQHPK